MEIIAIIRTRLNPCSTQAYKRNFYLKNNTKTLLLTAQFVMLIPPFSILKMSVDAGECESINYNQLLAS